MTTPRLRVEGACLRFGRSEVIRACNILLAGGTADPELVVSLGGRAAVRFLTDGRPDHQAYWLRVWGARGLLWAGTGPETSALGDALRDDHWRVREMACKVVARHRVGELLSGVARLEEDPIQRVRRAAVRAVSKIVEAEA